ncbi:P-loop containing nucleoside triphosphate hydrolase protein [Lipomyces arxii]|uniref:P-loop containing nucleoside triphosphate hydrolase protein n=1 Tax=Lipomyces arxii TaxID=56418 RepID=UPI0034CF9662
MASKRKHSDTGAEGIDSKVLDTSATFESFNLDARLLQAIARQDFTQPTLVQAKAIPLAFEGKDILARAKTGSGKTAAYVIPLIQTILRAKEIDTSEQAIRAIVFVPTKELAEQCLNVINKLLVFCGKTVKAINLAQNLPDQVQKSQLSECPDIVIGTPTRIVAHLKTNTLSVKNVTQIVIDEADLILSYGYEDDLNRIKKQLSKTAQIFLMSATLTADVQALKGLFCRNPAILTLHEEEVSGSADNGKVDQYMVSCAEIDKFLLAYVIFKLDLIKGRTIAFVNDIDRCYRLKLFLEQFGIRSCVLNSDLPVNSRIHVVDQFNKNIYRLLIATDEADRIAPDEEADADAEVSSKPKSGINKSKKVKRNDKEYGVSRGVDFHNVSCVLNFDLPTTAKAYTHRIGRTGRAGSSGMALSFVVPKDQWGKHKTATLDTAKRDEKVIARIQKEQKKYRDAEIKPYAFDMAQIDAFRYRMDDAFRAVTRSAIREARTKELKQEILASEKLKKHFEESPDELDTLRHDRELHAVRVQHHLKHVPDYLLPEAGRQGLVKNLGFVGIKKNTQNRIRRARAIHRAKGKPKRSDPLKSFKVKK